MTNERFQRVAGQIKKEVSQILREELKDPRASGFTSVTSVDVTRDLRYARIFVSIYGDKKEQEGVLQALNKAIGFIRKEIGRRIRLRHTPEISFHLDRSIEYGVHINEVLRTLKGREQEGDER